MGAMTRIWDAVQTHLMADPILVSEITTFLWSRKPKILKGSDMPCLMAYIDAAENEKFFTVPRSKTTEMVLQVHTKVWAESYPVLRQTLVYLDEEIKRALEIDLQLDQSAIILKVGESRFKQLSMYIGESQMSFNIRSTRFNAGSRRI